MITIKDGQRYSIRQLRLDNPQVSFPREMPPELLASYGVFEVTPVERPAHDPLTEKVSDGFEQQNGTWVHVWIVEPLSQAEQEQRDYDRSLSPVPFKWLLARTGLEDVWDAMLNATKGNDQATYAMLKAQLEQPSFRLGKTLDIIASLSDQIAAVAPGADVSEAAIRAAWAQAEEINI